MPRRIAVTNLQASTFDIINTIRANGTYEYQTQIPEVKQESDLPKVGDILYGYPALANQFINSLMNRIALVKIKSAVFNNAFAELKKGYLEFGETVEEVFVEIAKAREFSVEKAEAREHKRTLPDVRTAFHAMNWKVQYPVTVQYEDLRQAFTSTNGVQELILKLVDSVYTAAEYDEYLLFKYLLIKGISHGKLHPVKIGNGDMSQAAVAFRGTSNQLTFMSKEYNAYGVTTTTPKKDQYIFMDSMYNASYDVNVLAGAFNMDRTEFIGKLKLIDSWTTFDNDRFSEIIENSDMIEEVTEEELALMKDVKAVLADEEWFQVYDNLMNMTEAQVASGLYWNYFLNVWKTVSSSPFSNAIVFVTDNADTTLPTTINVEIGSKDASDNATVFTLNVNEETPALTGTNVSFIQTEDAVTKGIAVHKFGAVIFPADQTTTTLQLEVGGTVYTAGSALTTENKVGDTIAFTVVA